MPLHVFDWHTDYEKAGLAEGGLYLLRPDTYVALADRAGSVDPIATYIAGRTIRSSGRSPPTGGAGGHNEVACIRCFIAPIVSAGDLGPGL